MLCCPRSPPTALAAPPLRARSAQDATAEEGQAFVAGLGARSGFGDDWLRIWGLKFVMDGGVAGAALEEPFANDPNSTGHINWDPDAMAPIVSFAIANGWKVATHVVGDRTLRIMLDVYERALAENPGTPPGTLVIEHAFLANAEQRERAVRMGVAITVQHSLFYTNSADVLKSWGAERTSRVMPVRSWLDDGAFVAAGTDAVSPFDPRTGGARRGGEARAPPGAGEAPACGNGDTTSARRSTAAISAEEP